MTDLRPWGTWPSSLSAESIAASGIDLGFPALVGGIAYWCERRPTQQGRIALVRRDADGTVHDVTPSGADVHTFVHEYGGRAYVVGPDHAVVYTDGTDRRVHRLDTDGSISAITPEPAVIGDVRYAAFALAGEHVLAVREDHRGSGEAVNTLVRLALHAENPDGGEVLFEGTDFVGAPAVHDDQVAWVTWDHPDMPWDGGVLRRGRLTTDGLTELREVAGGPGRSAAQPRFTPSGDLVFGWDRDGWFRLHLDDGSRGEPRVLTPRAADHLAPEWVLGGREHVALADGRIVARWYDDSVARLCVIDPATGTVDDLDLAVSAVAELDADESSGRATVLLNAGFADRPSAIVSIDLTGGELSVLRTTAPDPDPALVPPLEPVTWRNADGAAVHGHWYAPRNGALVGPPDTAPPVVVMAHGGPTSMHDPVYDPRIAFWTSRGFGVLHVNYGGSTGYGRDYRNRLYDSWGIVDAADTVAGALALGERGLADAGRIVVRGGSAGGYLVLRVLTTSDAFAAGASYFGIGDLEALAQDTHKFESRYADRLVGPYPQAASTYRDRSPIDHLDKLSAPMVIFQGELDEVVPPSQAEDLAAALRERGLPVELHLYPEERHGFVHAENIAASLDAELAFYRRVLGL